LPDPDEIKVYFNNEAGEVARLVDGAAKRYRLLLSAMHTVDLAFM